MVARRRLSALQALPRRTPALNPAAWMILLLLLLLHMEEVILALRGDEQGGYPTERLAGGSYLARCLPSRAKAAHWHGAASAGIGQPIATGTSSRTS